MVWKLVSSCQIYFLHYNQGNEDSKEAKRAQTVHGCCKFIKNSLMTKIES